MDVWAWVNDRIDELNDNGNERLAAIMEEVPTAATDNRHDAVEALVPEGIALANSINDAWIGVYLRHWLLQSRILHRHDVSTGMQIAIDALDLAHDDKTRDCPQSVCTVQDVCSAWGIVDGDAEERVHAAQLMGSASVERPFSGGEVDCLATPPHTQRNNETHRNKPSIHNLELARAI